MNYEYRICETIDRVARITLNRPEKRHALRMENKVSKLP